MIYRNVLITLLIINLREYIVNIYMLYIYYNYIIGYTPKSIDYLLRIQLVILSIDEFMIWRIN